VALRPRLPSSLVASAAELNIKSTTQLIERQLLRQPWQQRAWAYYRVSGPLHFAGRFVGNALSKIKLIAAEEDDDDPGTEPQPTSNEAIKQAVKNLKSKRGGQASLLRNFGANLFICGEANLVGWEEPDKTQNWIVLSIDELVARIGDRSFGRRVGPGLVEVPLPEAAYVTRIWNESPQYSGLADSSVMTVLDDAELLILMTQAEKALSRSRIAGAGILKFPNSLLLPARGADDVRRGQGQLVHGVDATPTMEAFQGALTTPLEQFGHASEVVPIIVTGEGDALDQLQHMTLDRKQDARFKEKRETALQNMAVGIDLPPEVLLGTSQVSHWGAWQIEEQTFKAHLQPFIELVCDALTIGYLQPAAKRAGVKDPEKYIIWYDPAGLVVKPDRSGDAKDLHDRIVISDAALRRESDFPETDKPDGKEYAMRVGLKLADAKMAVTGEVPEPAAPEAEGGPPALPFEDKTAEERGMEDPDKPSDAAKAIPATADRPNPAATTTTPGPPTMLASAAPGRRLARLGTRLARLDQDLMQRLRIAGDAAVQRALERAGAKIRTKARHDQFGMHLSDGIANEDLACHMGREKVRALGFAVDDELDLPEDGLEDLGDNDLLAPALIPFRSKAQRWIADAQVAAMRDIAQSVAEERGIEFADLYDDIENRYADHFDEAGVVATGALMAGLLAFSRRRLFDSGAGAATVGEFDDVRVPAGLVRDVLRIAGGGGGEDPSVPTGGVGTGTLTETILEDQGVQTMGMQWDYGPAVRNSFDPHLDLDGLSFTSWSDPALEVNPDDAWLGTEYYHPGDHNGCLCAVVQSFTLTSGEEE